MHLLSTDEAREPQLKQVKLRVPFADGLGTLLVGAGGVSHRAAAHHLGPVDTPISSTACSGNAFTSTCKSLFLLHFFEQQAVSRTIAKCLIPLIFLYMLR